MTTHHLRTSDIAKAVGVHHNTIRLYEQLGFLPPVPRGDNGYRLFTKLHLDQARLIRLALCSTWLGSDIRRSALAVIYASAKNNLTTALTNARAHHRLIRDERGRAEAAADVLEHWAQSTAAEDHLKPISISKAAQLLHTTKDALYNWERNGMIGVPRDPKSGYRLYGTSELNRLRVIRTLRQARFSTMSILRMLHLLDEGNTDNIRQALGLPVPDDYPPDDTHAYQFYNTDQWLMKLGEIEKSARNMVKLVKAMTTG
ncbi:MAG: MerR family transcriptional regulator [Chloroflexi bacterium]|jgi:DNA-binding transcriptional MerR regulator|nr:MerR family transcriptional regulator [Chloroflexota bacterium]MBT7080188.1 MerR family transcriptional regulator [Chloroflexota bacterium]MBT7290134.1 MerR family transcriptional regulator [Chloroflexota bacterium]